MGLETDITERRLITSNVGHSNILERTFLSSQRGSSSDRNCYKYTSEQITKLLEKLGDFDLYVSEQGMKTLIIKNRLFN